MAQTAELPQHDNSLEQRFANYAEQAHPEIFADLPPEERPKPVVPRETEAPEAPAAAVTEAPVEEPAEPTEAEQPVRFEFETADELAKRLEVPLDAILALKLKTKVDDQEGEYTLADIQKGFQLDKHNQNKSKELSAQQEKANLAIQQYEAYQAAAKQNLDNLNALGKYAQEMLTAEFQQVNWQQLQATDPIGYITTRQNFQDRQTQINTYLAQVNQQSQSQQAQAQTRQQAQIQEVLKNRATIRPEWADEVTFNKDTMAIRDSFLSHGFKAEDLPALLTNPAYLAAADAATRWWNLQKQKPEVTAQVRTAPKLIKGNTRIGSVKPSGLSASKAQLKANPKDRDIASDAFAEWATEASKAGLL